MSGSNWFKRFKIELAIFFAVLVLIAWSVLVWHLAQRELHYRQSAEHQASKYGPTSEEKSNSSCATIAGLGDVIDCVVQKIAASRKTQRDEQDLAAQQGMSEWALWMVLLTGAQAVLSFFGIVLLVRNLGLAREANGNTLDAIEQERKSTERELRAYISVTPDGINPLRETKAVIGHILVKNVGHVIAQEIRVSIFMELDKGKVRTKFPITKTDSTPIGSMHPTSEIRMGTSGTVHEHQMTLPIPANMKGGANGEYVYVWGSITYKDGFEGSGPTPTRVTDFCYRYDMESHDRIRGRVRIKKDIARYHGLGNYAT